MSDFKELDPILHSQLRLAVVSLLMGLEVAEFNFIKEKTASSAGNLSVQITKLEEAGYLEVEKTYRDKRPLTLCKLTAKGRKAFLQYVNNLQNYIGKK